MARYRATAWTLVRHQRPRQLTAVPVDRLVAGLGRADANVRFELSNRQRPPVRFRPSSSRTGKHERMAAFGRWSGASTTGLGRTLPFNTYPLIDRFLGAIAREQTDRFRPFAPQSRLSASNWH